MKINLSELIYNIVSLSIFTFAIGYYNGSQELYVLITYSLSFYLPIHFLRRFFYDNLWTDSNYS